MVETPAEHKGLRESLNEALKNDNVEIGGALRSEHSSVASAGSLRFVADLSRAFEARRLELLSQREERQRAIDSGALLAFPAETRAIREGEWMAAPIARDLVDRRVEITGPTDRKMVINALNSGAKVFMADFEDSNSPTWSNMIDGQLNIYDAVRGTASYTSPEGKQYRLSEKRAVLCVRPRGWHMVERHVKVDGKPISASLFDFGLYFFNNTKELISRGSGPYFYLPKLEGRLEARLWNDVFLMAEEALGIPRGTVRATVLIENVLAVFEAEEILYELREHAGGLNPGRWDYIFSVIKKLRNRPGFVLPDRQSLTMASPFLKAYSELIVQICHRRGVHAIGGMAAQVPSSQNPDNGAAIARVVSDKEREVSEGYDGAWVAHPALVPYEMTVFDKHLQGSSQIGTKGTARTITAADLLDFPAGNITEAGMRTNITAPLKYLEAWLRGTGAVAINFLMEDAATVEISRAQLWQWIRQKASLSDGRPVTVSLFRELLNDELVRIAAELGEQAMAASRFNTAAKILDHVVSSQDFAGFVTLEAYDYLD